MSGKTLRQADNKVVLQIHIPRGLATNIERFCHQYRINEIEINSVLQGFRYYNGLTDFGTNVETELLFSEAV